MENHNATTQSSTKFIKLT